MIKEIFIADSLNNLLVGNSIFFEKSRNSEKIKSLRINDIILSVCFTEIDPFTATRFLVDLKTAIEKRIFEISVESVKMNYFLILDLIKTPETVYLFQKTKVFTGDVFINIVQRVQCVIKSGKVLMNQSYGDVFLAEPSQIEQYLYKISKQDKKSGSIAGLKNNRLINPNQERKKEVSSELNNVKSETETQSDEQIVLKFEKRENIAFKTPYPFSIKENMVEITANSLQNRNILSFGHKNETVYFKMTRTGDIYVFESNYPGKYKFIEFKIPLGPGAYRAEIKSTSGSQTFDRKTGEVSWRFTDKVFEKEKIKIKVESLEEETLKGNCIKEKKMPVRVDFKIEDSDSLVKLVGCSSKNLNLWMRSIIQCLNYEIHE